MTSTTTPTLLYAHQPYTIIMAILAVAWVRAIIRRNRAHASLRSLVYVKKLRDDESNPLRRWLDIWDIAFANGCGYTYNREDAVLVVNRLQRLLLEEQVQGQLADKSGDRPQRAAGLCFGEPWLSDAALDVFCEFLRKTTQLRALRLDFQDHKTNGNRRTTVNEIHRRLLVALYTNKSVKELYVYGEPSPGFVADHLAKLTRYKKDFEVLCFSNLHSRRSPYIVPILRQLQSNLRKLVFRHCNVDDDSIQSIVRGLLDGNHKRLEELDLSCNFITSRGLLSMCALNPSVFPCLQKLNLSRNFFLLKENDTAQRFVRELLWYDSTLKELHMCHCAFNFLSIGYTFVVKALETNRTLQLLDISSCPDLVDQRSIRDQLVESLPKLTGLQHLIAEEEFFDEGDDEFMAAFHSNISLTHISCGKRPRPVETPILLDILRRNEFIKQVRQVESLSRPTSNTASTRTTSIPRSLWSPALATVGQHQEGPSLVFMILQDQLATWPQIRSICDKKECSN